MIRVLSEEHHLDSVNWAKVEGIEDEPAWRIASSLGIGLAHKICKFGKIGLVKLRLQGLLPRWLNLYVHVCGYVRYSIYVYP